MGIDDFIQMGMDGDHATQTASYIDTLRERISAVRTKDTAIKEFAKKEKDAEKLELFMN